MNFIKILRVMFKKKFRNRNYKFKWVKLSKSSDTKSQSLHLLISLLYYFLWVYSLLILNSIFWILVFLCACLVKCKRVQCTWVGERSNLSVIIFFHSKWQIDSGGIVYLIYKYTYFNIFSPALSNIRKNIIRGELRKNKINKEYCN